MLLLISIELTMLLEPNETLIAQWLETLFPKTLRGFQDKIENLDEQL